MIVEKGKYIVVMKLKGNTISSCAKENYCFKQRETDSYIRPELDLNFHPRNGHCIFKFDNTDCLKLWRYATNKEIEEYNRLGKPYDVTTLSHLTPPVEYYGYVVSVGHCAVGISGFDKGAIGECLKKNQDLEFPIGSGRVWAWNIADNDTRWFSTYDEALKFSKSLTDMLPTYNPYTFEPNSTKPSSDVSDNIFFIKYDSSITEDLFKKLCDELGKRIGPYRNHIGTGEKLYEEFKTWGYLRTNIPGLDQHWCIDNNDQNIKTQKYIHDFISVIKDKPEPELSKYKYKIGDYVVTKGYSHNYDNRVLRITKISGNNCCYFDVFDGGYYEKSHNFDINSILRSATQSEIEIIKKRQPTKEKPIFPKTYDSWVKHIIEINPSFDELKDLIRYRDTCDFDGVYQKIKGSAARDKAKYIFDAFLSKKTTSPSLWDDEWKPETFKEFSSGILESNGTCVITSVGGGVSTLGTLYDNSSTTISVKREPTVKTFSHQKPYIPKISKKTSKFVRITR